MSKPNRNIVSNEHHLAELEQEKIIFQELMQEITQKVNKLQEAKQILEEQISINSRSSKETNQEEGFLNELNNTLSTQQKKLEKIKNYYEKELSEKHHTIKELKQEKIILTQMNQSMKETIEKLGKTNLEMEAKLSRIAKQSKLSQQARTIIAKTYDEESTKKENITRKYYLTIALAAVVFAAVIVPYSLYTMTLVGQEYQIEDLGTIESGYVIQNLKGVTIDTWLSWRITDGDVLYVNIVNGEEYPEKAELVKNTILSNENIKVDNKLINSELDGTSTFYLGWVGALEKASQFPTELYIPKNIEVITVTNGAGEIIIRLEDKSHGDGISGLTESIADEHQILKSTITIYDVEDISDNQLQTVARHELGHAFGLSHSSDPDDLMHPTIKTGFPYISECDVRALALLYDGRVDDKVVCVK